MSDSDSISSDRSCSPCTAYKTSFDTLVTDLRNILGCSSGIDSEDVDVEDLIGAMRKYRSDATEWEPYAWADLSRGYTRNLVDEGNGKANLLILVWSPGKGSLIHDHANAHCIMKVLAGTLVETLYDWPSPGGAGSGASNTSSCTAPMQVRKITKYLRDEVTYISDKIGLHSVSNPDPRNVAVSLHLYTPPYAAKFGCRKFDEKTGKPTRVTMCDYFSRYGKRDYGANEERLITKQPNTAVH